MTVCPLRRKALFDYKLPKEPVEGKLVFVCIYTEVYKRYSTLIEKQSHSASGTGRSLMGVGVGGGELECPPQSLFRKQNQNQKH